MEALPRMKSAISSHMEIDDEFNQTKPDPKLFRLDLYNAVMKDETTIVLAFLLDGVPCDHVDVKSRLTCLHWAALHGNVLLVKKLLEAGASSVYHRAYGRNRQYSANTSTNNNMNESNLAEYENDAFDEEKSADNDSASYDSDSSVDNEEFPETNNIDDNGDVTIDFTKNTPMLWAAYKGHFEVVWLLLLDGYSSNDLDDNGNNALHLAAVGGYTKVAKTLIDDGANANLVNLYKNLPIDMASVKDIREMLAIAMEKYASNTADDIKAMNRQNIKLYKGLIQDIQRAIKDATSFESKSADGISYTMKSLEEKLRTSKEWELDVNLLQQAERLVQKMETVLDLNADMNSLRAIFPLNTQADYSKYVLSLERSVKKAEGLDIDRNRIASARNLILQAQAEYWVSTCTNRLKDVSCAEDEHEHDMNKLKLAIDKYETRPCSVDLINTGRSLYLRLHSELGMMRSIRDIPVFRLPMDSPPPGYWQPVDIGKIRETIEYPNPPIEPPGEYIWEPSTSYTALKDAISRLREYTEGAVQYAANAALTATAKEKLVKAEKEFKLLEVKNTADKALGIEAVIKLAKKLKKKKKKATSAGGAGPSIKSPRAASIVAGADAVSESENEEEEE